VRVGSYQLISVRFGGSLILLGLPALPVHLGGRGTMATSHPG